MYVMRIHAKFQSSNKYLFFNYFLFQGVLLEIVFRGMWSALAVRLDTDRGRYIPETHEWLTEDGGTGSGEQVEKRRKSRTESRENWMKSGVWVSRVWVVSSKFISQSPEHHHLLTFSSFLTTHSSLILPPHIPAWMVGSSHWLPLQQGCTISDQLGNRWVELWKCRYATRIRAHFVQL